MGKIGKKNILFNGDNQKSESNLEVINKMIQNTLSWPTAFPGQEAKYEMQLEFDEGFLCQLGGLGFHF